MYKRQLLSSVEPTVFSGALPIADITAVSYTHLMDFDEMTAVIEKAIAGANAEGVRGKNITPYLLAHIVEYTGGQSLKTNIQLAYNNARAAGKIAVAYARL